jgi:hypothetical protein
MSVRLLILIAFIFNLAQACSIPVYRYAISQWDVDAYRLVVFHKAPLNAAHNKIIDNLKACFPNNSGGKSGRGQFLEIQIVSPDDSAAAQYRMVMKDYAKLPFPWAAVMFPRNNSIPIPVWAGALDSLPVKNLAVSPARETINRHLLSGETAVWVFVESGDKSKDEAALKALDAGLKMCSDSLKLPETTREDREQLGDIANGLKVSFSIVKISRTSAPEAHFLKMLMYSERGLGAFENEPLAFPVFGRGRILYTLAGKGINANNIREANSFLTGPCVCTVKDQNPGKDILMACSWDAANPKNIVAKSNASASAPMLRSMSSGQQCETNKSKLSESQQKARE